MLWPSCVPLVLHAVFFPEVMDARRPSWVALQSTVLTCSWLGAGWGGWGPRDAADLAPAGSTSRHLLALTPASVPNLQLAAERLEKMGPMSRDEKIMLATMGAAVCLWVAGDSLGISAGKPTLTH